MNCFYQPQFMTCVTKNEIERFVFITTPTKEKKNQSSGINQKQIGKTLDGDCYSTVVS